MNATGRSGCSANDHIFMGDPPQAGQRCLCGRYEIGRFGNVVPVAQSLSSAPPVAAVNGRCGICLLPLDSDGHQLVGGYWRCARKAVPIEPEEPHGHGG